MKAVHQRAEPAEAELIADLEDEAALLRRQKSVLEFKIKDLQRDLRRARRNVGYRIFNGISRALKPVSHYLFRNGAAGTVRFARPRHSADNGATPLPTSVELRSLLGTLGATLSTVFFTSSTQQNWVFHKLLGRKPNRLCFSQEELLATIKDSFLTVPDQPLALSERPPAFADQDLVVVDCDDPGPLWPLLKGRFWPHQKILLRGKGTPRDFPATQSGPDFCFYAAPATAWLDPRHAYQPPFTPWKSSRRRLSAKLPSGNSWPKISVITPSFNQGKFITDTIESVFGQNYPDLEYLVLDGGSTDETRGILDRYRPRLAYSCSQKDNGQADAINQGFARSTGEILAWLNSDDQYAPDALMHVAAAFDLFPDADIVVGGCGLVRASGSVPERIHHCALPIGKVVPLPLAQLLDLDKCWLKGHFFYQPEVFWRRRIWEAAGAHVADDLYYCFDYDLWVRMAQAGAKIVHLPDLLALYRIHPAQKTFGDHLPYLPELKVVKSRREGSSALNETVAKA